MLESLEDLEEIVAYNRAILDTVADGIICIDSKGVITTFTRSSEKIFGYSADEVLGKKINMLMPSSHAERHDSYLLNYKTTGKAKLVGTRPEVEGKRKSGEIFPMEVGLTECLVKGEKIFVGVVRDITERKRVDRLKSEFIATVSHELRTPLTSIYGPLALMKSTQADALPPKMQKVLDIALRNCGHLSSLIENLLDFEKLSSGKARFVLEDHDVRGLVSRAAQENRGYAESYGIELVSDIDPSDAWIVVDQGRFSQVLTNLISNAIKFSRRDGRVTLSVQSSDTGVRVLVEDQGVGIPEEHHDRLFQRFSQVDGSATRKVGGTGLGLAISKELTEQMGGEIGFSSEVGQGSTFWVQFPRHRPCGAQVTPEGRPKVADTGMAKVPAPRAVDLGSAA